ncbi:MAG: type II toxin-antitoxin system VapC family toxin [Rhodanobacteraceae bacterium]
MFVLDTNVISELFKPVPDPKVMTWVAELPGDDVFTTAVTRGELLFGLYCIPEGRRRSGLLLGLRRLFDEKLTGHVLAYDDAAADAYASIAAQRRAQGHPAGQSGMMIAGIVRSRGAALATRNVRDFEGCGIELVDPWQ